MQVNIPIDIADAIQQALYEAGMRVSARPVPRSLGDDLPVTVVEALPGVMDKYRIDSLGEIIGGCC